MDGANLDSFFYRIGLFFIEELNQIHPLKCQYVKRYIWNKYKCKTAPKLFDCIDLITPLNKFLYEVWRYVAFSNFSMATGSVPSISCTTTPPSPSQKSSATFWSEERPHKLSLSRKQERGTQAAATDQLLFVYLHSSIIATLFLLLLWRRRSGRKKKIGDCFCWSGGMFRSISRCVNSVWSGQEASIFRAEFFLQEIVWMAYPSTSGMVQASSSLHGSM